MDKAYIGKQLEGMECEMENKQERSRVGTKEHFNVFNVFSM